MSANNNGRKVLFLICLSAVSIALAIASVASNFASIEQKNPALGGEVVEFSFDLFQFCTTTTAPTPSEPFCTRHGSFPVCSSLSHARSATATFLIIAIILEGFCIFYLLAVQAEAGEDFYSCRFGSGRRRRTRRRVTFAAAVQPSTANQNDGSNNNNNTQQENNDNNNTSTTSTTSVLPSCITGLLRSFAEFAANKSNFKIIFLSYHVSILCCAFLAFAIDFSLTGESHCDKKILVDFVPVYRNSTKLISSNVGPSAPCALGFFFAELVILGMFWKFGALCQSDDVDTTNIIADELDDESGQQAGDGGRQSEGQGGEYTQV